MSAPCSAAGRSARQPRSPSTSPSGPAPKLSGSTSPMVSGTARPALRRPAQSSGRHPACWYSTLLPLCSGVSVRTASLTASACEASTSVAIHASKSPPRGERIGPAPGGSTAGGSATVGSAIGRGDRLVSSSSDSSPGPGRGERLPLSTDRLALSPLGPMDILDTSLMINRIRDLVQRGPRAAISLPEGLRSTRPIHHLLNKLLAKSSLGKP
mmetsp:Transcript_97372/g.223158  ORF Transcript_97372/g.223158 Transcript_97372/m.223158 type:complete len:212 (-) Transcript_97372:127-762(-)